MKISMNNLGFEYEEPYPCIYNYPLFDKTSRFQTDLHYSDPDAHKELDVFGQAKKGLFYNYSDRLYGDLWREGENIAKKMGHEPRTAIWYETILNHYHQTDNVDLQHVILGCNRSNGFPYLIFGYTYSSKKGL